MSGPKVVRIVSREELVMRCEGLLARLDATREDWIRVGRRNDVLTDEEIGSVLSRHTAMRELLSANRFAELQRQVPAEMASLHTDLDRRLTAAAAAEAAARAADRRRAQAAMAVLRMLETSGCDIPVDLQEALKRAAAGDEDGRTAIAQGFSLLATSATTSLTQRQRELALAHREGDDDLEISTWIAREGRAQVESMLAKVDGYVATLRGLTDNARCAPFEHRAARLAASPEDPTLSAKVDTLVVELARAVDEARTRSDLEWRLKQLATELRQLGTDPALAVADATLAGLTGALDALRETEERSAIALEQFRSEAAASGRRRAVLEGLASLGYEVTEQMETAWVANGRVVLRQTTRPAYGVEIGGGADAARVQFRTVAFREPTAPPDVARDRDAETVWCGDVDALRRRFANGGGEIVIEQALGVGVAPLRAVGRDSDSERREERARPAPALAKRLGL